MRTSEQSRKTKETDIYLKLNLDGEGIPQIDTGIGFFDHMLELLSVHSGIDLQIKCKGDTRVDGHHSVEDVGIVFGKAICEALGDKRGIDRYSSVTVPMDEALCSIAIDISGRPAIVFNAKYSGKVGDFDMELIEEFFKAVVTNAGMALHVNLLYGNNNHHDAEAIFKGFARALKAAIRVVGTTIPSSKGIL